MVTVMTDPDPADLYAVSDTEAAGQPHTRVRAADRAPVEVRGQAVSLAVAVVDVPGAQVEREVDQHSDNDDSNQRGPPYG